MPVIVTLRVAAGLAERQDEYFAFEASFLEGKLLRKGAFSSREEYRLAFTELKKYLWLVAVTGRELAMYSRTVDEVWHQFILFTREYHAFCDRFFGHYMHHGPFVAPPPDDGGADLLEFLRAYREHFGPLSRVWLESLILESDNLPVWY
jgi:hypothetical protein